MTTTSPTPAIEERARINWSAELKRTLILLALLTLSGTVIWYFRSRSDSPLEPAAIVTLLGLFFVIALIHDQVLVALRPRYRLTNDELVITGYLPTNPEAMDIWWTAIPGHRLLSRSRSRPVTIPLSAIERLDTVPGETSGETAVLLHRAIDGTDRYVLSPSPRLLEALRARTR